MEMPTLFTLTATTPAGNEPVGHTSVDPTDQAQLTLLCEVDAPRSPAPSGIVRPRRRLDERTRQIGLAGVAQARAILAEQARRRAEREAAEHPTRIPARPRHDDQRAA